MTLSIREYIYIACVLLLGGALAYEHFHSEAVQAAKDKAADQRVADAQVLNNQKVEDLVKLRVQQILDAQPPSPTVPTPVLVCHATKASASKMPEAGGTPSSMASGPGSVEQNPQGFDPSPAVLKDTDSAELQIQRLTKYIKALQDAGIITKN